VKHLAGVSARVAVDLLLERLSDSKVRNVVTVDLGAVGSIAVYILDFGFDLVPLKGCASRRINVDYDFIQIPVSVFIFHFGVVVLGNKIHVEVLV
jgi:hypothetical protein